MADKKISAMTLLAAADIDIDADYLPIVDASEASAADKNKRVLVGSLVSVGDQCVVVTTGNGHGSTNFYIRRFTTTQENSGGVVTYADSATLGGTFTIVTPGLYTINYVDGHLTASLAMGLSVNSSQLTTTVASITAANRLAFGSGRADTGVFTALCITATRRLAAGDVIRAHGGEAFSSPPNFTSDITRFEIRRIGP